ncbi:hypothetical protein PORY_000895 [Pneumocystis oryctolagi]|uniref:Uncharacterized protein n=1 Tax=Pneumocystis oryctolagi TaxID=42067 RepID=A0ACB7CF28_9ASCO|nr:hypothetical protein PORY_000895 [Pneumocystis oryctolagi]
MYSASFYAEPHDIKQSIKNPENCSFLKAAGSNLGVHEGSSSSDVAATTLLSTDDKENVPNEKMNEIPVKQPDCSSSENDPTYSLQQQWNNLHISKSSFPKRRKYKIARTCNLSYSEAADSPYYQNIQYNSSDKPFSLISNPTDDSEMKNPQFISTHQGGSKINPEKVPSVAFVHESSQGVYKNNAFFTMESHVLPTANTDFIAIDQGISSPKFLRLTTRNIPETKELAISTFLPISMVIQPFAQQRPEEHPIPLVDYGELGPPRCRRCKAYINPFVNFIQGGTKFVCNMCLFPNDVGAEWFSPLNGVGKRQDLSYRSELKYGTVEFSVPKEYETCPPEPIKIIFTIDVSETAIQKGVPKIAADAIRKALYESPDRPFPSGAKICIITFDRTLHFYNLTSSLKDAQMLVVSDIEDTFIPLQEGLFVDAYESRHIIETVLTYIPTLFDHTRVPEPALGALVQSSFIALEKTGGKLIIFLSALSTWGPGSLRFREDSKLYNTDNEKQLFTSQNVYWNNLAKKCLSAGIGVDLFLFPTLYMDISTIGVLASVTGGEIYYYQDFIEERDSPKVIEEFIRNVTREQAYHVQIKVRCSNGLSVEKYIGNYVQKKPSELELSVIDSEKAISVSFTHDSKLDQKSCVYFQCAVLYTTSTGRRRLRCYNTVASVSSNLSDIIKYVDIDACITVLVKDVALLKIVKSSLKQIRDELTEICIGILTCYRKSISSSVPTSQLVLPENLKLLPIYILCLLKLPALKSGNIQSDLRMQNAQYILTMGVRELVSFIYPRIIPLHNLSDHMGFPDEKGNLVLPKTIRASSLYLNEGGVYLMINGSNAILWFHNSVSSNLLKDLYGNDVSKLSDINIRSALLPELNSRFSIQVRNIFLYFNTFYPGRALVAYVSRQGLDESAHEFMAQLVEDKHSNSLSYTDFLCYIHREIQLELSGNLFSNHGKNDSNDIVLSIFLPFCVKRCRICMSFKDWIQQQGSTLPGKHKVSTANGIEWADCPPDSESLGRATWTFLHTMAANYPELATAEEQSEMRNFLTIFAKRYPCIYCAQDFREWMHQKENEMMVSGRKELSLWMCKAHNEVNRKLGKPIFDCIKWKERWLDGWNDGRCG